jgi:hypothetical protein
MMTHDEVQNELLEKMALDFENKAWDEMQSNKNSYHDCALIAKMWIHAAIAVRKYKTNDTR